MLFGDLQMVYQRRQFITINHLKQTIVTEWGNLLQRLVDHAVAPLVSGVTGLSASSSSKAVTLSVLWKLRDVKVTLDKNKTINSLFLIVDLLQCVVADIVLFSIVVLRT